MSALVPAGDDEGAVAAELALAMPAVIVVLALALGAVQLGTVRLRAQDVAADVARSAARGDGPDGDAAWAAASREVRSLHGAPPVIRRGGGLVCAEVRVAGAARGPLAAVHLSASACALDGGA